MKSRWLAVALIISMLASPVALGSPGRPIAPGNDLYDACMGPQGTDYLGCSSYVAGITDIIQSMGPQVTRVCLPQVLNLKQLSDIALKYLLLNPEHRSESAAVSVWASLILAFPCSGQ